MFQKPAAFETSFFHFVMPGFSVLFLAESGAFGLRGGCSSVSGDINAFCLTDMFLVVDAVADLAADFSCGIWSLKLVFKCSSAAFIKTSAAGFRDAAGLGAFHDDFIFAAAVFAVVNTGCHRAL